MHLGIQNQNKTVLCDQKHRGTTSSLVSCHASRYHALNVPTQHLKAEGSLFCLWFKLAGREPAPIWRQCNFSVQWSVRLKLTRFCCVYKSYFFPWVCLGSLELRRYDLFCNRWHSCMLYHICLFFFFGKQLIEILLRNFKALHFFCSTYTPKFAVWNFEQQQLMVLAIFCVQLLCYCST